MGIPYLGGVAQYLKELDLPGDFAGFDFQAIDCFPEMAYFLGLEIG